MPNWTLSELMSTATTRAGRRSDISQSVVSQMVNESYFEVAASVEPAHQERIAVSSTTSGENRLDLPTDYFEFINASMKWSTSTSSSAVSSTKTLYRMSASAADANGFYPVGEPEAYVLYNNWLELWPSPDSAYSLQLRYRSMVTDMLDTTAVPSIATPYRQAILIKTMQKVLQHVGDYAGASIMNQEYVDYMNRQKSDEYRRQAGESPQGLHPVYGQNTRTRYR
jgi:hypothetical protein